MNELIVLLAAVFVFWLLVWGIGHIPEPSTGQGAKPLPWRWALYVNPGRGGGGVAGEQVRAVGGYHMAGLTNRQRAFIEHYLKHWNATKAAELAGRHNWISNGPQ